jgi:3-methyladenine DNA glycosylase AlkD
MPVPGDAALALAAEIERALRADASAERAEQEKRYLRSELAHLGASVPAIRKVAVAFARQHAWLDRRALLGVAEALWARRIHECRMAAVDLLELREDLLHPHDLAGVVERFLREARTWALVDGLAANVAGALVERIPELGAVLDRWARDGDFWLRRAALLAELVPLREGRGDFARFARHADALLEEREFFVRKAIGWVLRDASRKDPERVARWVLPRARRASALTLREATRHLTPAQRQEILAAAQRKTGPAPAGAARHRAQHTAQRG